MADLQCTWCIVRTDHYEFVTDEHCTLPQLLEQVAELVNAWDDPSVECPTFELARFTPDERAAHEAQTKRVLEAQAAMKLFKGGSNG